MASFASATTTNCYCDTAACNCSGPYSQVYFEGRWVQAVNSEPECEPKVIRVEPQKLKTTKVTAEPLVAPEIPAGPVRSVRKMLNRNYNYGGRH